MAAVATGVLSGVFLFIIWRNVGNADQEKLTFEAGKTLMQVIGVVLLGAVFSYAAAAISSKHQHGMLVQQLVHTSAEAERVRDHSDWQRKTDQQKDQRLRQDELRRALLDATIANYNTVKRVRRQLRAAGYRGPDAVCRLLEPHENDKARVVFVDALEALIEAQLEFERLSKTAHLASVHVKLKMQAADRARPTTIKRLDAVYSQCAQYLNSVLDNYIHEAVPDPGPQRPGALGTFLAHRTEEGGFGQFSRTANAAMKALRKELTKPMKVTEEKAFSIDLAKIEGDWRQVLAEAPFSQKGDG